MSADATYSFLRLGPESPALDLTTFDCGVDAYDQWLARSAAGAVKAGTAAVHLLVQHATDDGALRVVGYVAIAPTAVVRDDLPGSVASGMPTLIPGYLLAKMALDSSLRGDRQARWGTQLLVEALRRIVDAATVGGGRVIVVDADDERLLGFYRGHSFLPTGVSPLRLYMKVATARSLLDRQPERHRGGVHGPPVT